MKNILSALGYIGIGSFLGVIIQIFFDNRREKRRILFEARVKAYGTLVGRLFNLFLEPDISRLEEALRVAKMNQLLSEANLVGSKETLELLLQLKNKVNSMHKEFEQKLVNDERARILHKELSILAGKVHEQMRKDLYLESDLYDELHQN